MIKRFTYGNPIETDAVLDKPNSSQVADIDLKIEDGSIRVHMDEDVIVYGLGENVRGINKRGWTYTSNCSDDPNHRENTHSLYGAHNFLLLSDKKGLARGIFMDMPEKVVFDVGYTKYDELIITPSVNDFDLYIIDGDNPDQVVTEFRTLIGTSYIPPKWAFGYGQSRWSYMSSDEVKDVVNGHRNAGIPIDSVYLDIDYMERYKDFTINEETFPDFEAFVSEMKANHIHLVPIIDAGVKKEEGYDVYEEGHKSGYFCKDENGEDFIVGVWPGKCCLPDMLNDEARAWFGEKYSFLLDKGIDGFWNDMNEPALFYSEKRLNELFERLPEYQKENLDINKFFEFQGEVNSLCNNPEDYAAFYHNYKGKTVNHSDVHNLFGYFMTRSASEAFEKLSPDKRILMYSRASYIGMHRYGGIWQGDNMAWWSHLLMNLKMMPSLNMCGFLYTGADLGGFGCDTTEDLMVRWLSLAIFTPLMRNHAAKGTRRQEVYDMSLSDKCRDIIKLRYRLIPYLYSEFVKAAQDNKMMFRPLGFVYNEDDIARHIEDELLIGDEIMIAPVVEQNAVGRGVYIPEDMYILRFKEGELISNTPVAKGYHYIEMPLGEVCIFLKKGHIIPIAQGGQFVGDNDEELTLIYGGTEADCVPYCMYLDDGVSTDMSKGQRKLLK